MDLRPEQRIFFPFFENSFFFLFLRWLWNISKNLIISSWGNGNHNFENLSYSSQNAKVQQNNWQPMLQGMWRKQNLHLLLVELQAGMAALETTVENSQEANTKSIMWLSYSSPWCLSERLCIRLYRYLLSHLHCCSIPNNYMPFSWPINSSIKRNESWIFQVNG